MATKTDDIDDIDEAKEEELLKSDDDSDTSNVKHANDEAELDFDKDDTDSDDENEENKVIAEFNSMLGDIEKEPFSYEKYLKLCDLSHLTDDIQCIRKAYNLFAEAYPLSPELWLKLLTIEQNIAHSTSEMDYLENLFRKALSDYFSVDVAIGFSKIAKRTVHPEDIWNEILGTYALDCMRGQELYKSYREYISKRTDIPAHERNSLHLKSYLQELQYPLHNMENSYIEFKVLYERKSEEVECFVDWEEFDKMYFHAKEDLLKILPFEETIESMDKNCYRERADTYFDYIKNAQKFLDDRVLQIIHERMVTDCCLNPQCWIVYIDFIAGREKYDRDITLPNLPVFNQSSIDITKRALRNCTWSEMLYIKFMHLLEMKGSSREEVQEILESAMAVGFQSPEPIVAIWLEYLTYLRRNTNWKDDSECDILRKNFNLAWTILGQQWGVLADCNCEILKFWGKLEYNELGNPIKGRELWTTVMESSDNATKSGLWIEFTQMESGRDIEGTRRLYQKALNTTGLDNVLVIILAWERFERCYGSIKSLSFCKNECGNILLAQNTSLNKENSKKVSKKQVGKGNKRKLEEQEQHTIESKVKRVDAEVIKKENEKVQNLNKMDFKSHETQEIDYTKDKCRVFLSNLDFDLDENGIRENFLDLKIEHIDLIRSANGRSRGFGYLELANEGEVDKALSMDRRTINGRPVFISSVLRDKEKRQKFKYSGESEPQKLFIKNLPVDTTKEELTQIFGKYGELKDIRMVYHKSGTFKNIAYVEFEEEADAGRALLGSNLMDLRGHRISVSISAPPPKTIATPAAERIMATINRKNKLEKKPRMTLIPNIVRKKFSTNPANGLESTRKTNEEFREILQRK